MNLDAFHAPFAVRLWLAAFGTALALALVIDAWQAHDAALSRLQGLEEQLKYKKGLLARRDELAAKLAQMRPELDEALRRLPDAFDPAALEQAMRETATSADVELDEVRFEKGGTKEFYATLPASVRIHGPIERVLDFVARIKRGAPIRQVTRVRIEPDADANTIRASIFATYYRHIEDD